MVAVQVKHYDGRLTKLELSPGLSLMEGAVAGGIEELLADCGGSLSCATCHVYIEEGWFDRLPAPTPTEIDMLEFAIDPRATSRLSCQIRIEPDLDGLGVELPERQQ